MWRRCLSVWIKSLAEMIPTIVRARESQSGADEMDCSCSAWNACRTEKSMSMTTTLPDSGMSSYAVWDTRKSCTFLRVAFCTHTDAAVSWCKGSVQISVHVLA